MNASYMEGDCVIKSAQICLVHIDVTVTKALNWQRTKERVLVSGTYVRKYTKIVLDVLINRKLKIIFALT